MKGKIQ